MVSIQFTSALVDALAPVNDALAALKGIQAMMFPPPGPLFCLFESSRAVLALAQKVGIPTTGKCVTFVINSEQDLPRVFAEVRRFSREVNHVKDILTNQLLEALEGWADSAAGQTSSVVGNLAGSDIETGLGVLDRVIPLTPRLLSALHLLNTGFAKFTPARFGIFPLEGPITIAMNLPAPTRIAANQLGIPSWGRYEVIFITNVENASTARDLLRQLSARAMEMAKAIPPNLPGGASSGK